MGIIDGKRPDCDTVCIDRSAARRSPAAAPPPCRPAACAHAALPLPLLPSPCLLDYYGGYENLAMQTNEDGEVDYEGAYYAELDDLSDDALAEVFGERPRRRGRGAGAAASASVASTTDCTFFLEGRCAKGDACAFRHPEGISLTVTE